MIANVAHRCSVLKDNDSKGKTGVQRASQASKIAHEVEKAVDFAASDCKVARKLIRDGHLHVVSEIVHAEGSVSHFERPKRLFVQPNRKDPIVQVKLGHIDVVVIVCAHLWRQNEPAKAGIPDKFIVFNVVSGERDLVFQSDNERALYPFEYLIICLAFSLLDWRFRCVLTPFKSDH